MDIGLSINIGLDIAIYRSTKLVAVKKKNANATTIFTGCSNWERVPNESEGLNQSPAIATVKVDSIGSKNKKFSPRGIFVCGGPRSKIATVYASKPYCRSDLIHLRFYVYSDKQDSKMVSDQMRDRNEGTILKYT